MEALALSGLLGFLRAPTSEPALEKITEKELENLREQKRLVDDAAKVQRMLYVSFQTAMKSMELKYRLPEGSSIDLSSGEIVLEKSDG